MERRLGDSSGGSGGVVVLVVVSVACWSEVVVNEFRVMLPVKEYNFEWSF